MEPATTIIEKLGGPTKVARAIGVHRVRVHCWRKPRSKGGTGGNIPHWHVSALLAYARERGIELSEKDFAPHVMEAA